MTGHTHDPRHLCMSPDMTRIPRGQLQVRRQQGSMRHLSGGGGMGYIEYNKGSAPRPAASKKSDHKHAIFRARDRDKKEMRKQARDQEMQ